MKMSHLYKNNNRFHNGVKLIVSLAFVPSVFMRKEADSLLDFFLNTNSNENSVNLLLWFDEQYIQSDKYKVKTEGKEFYYIWSVYRSVLQNLPKTTNSLEVCHRFVNSRIS